MASERYTIKPEDIDPDWRNTADGREAGYTGQKFIADVAEVRARELAAAVKKAAPPKDLKQSAGKPQVSQRPFVPAVWAARVYEYGASKYKRGNYLRASDLAPIDRASAYLDAAMRHLYQQAELLERTRGDALGGRKVGIVYPLTALDEESGLPHLAHALVSLEMLIAQLADAGEAPRDPGKRLFVRVAEAVK